MKTTSDVLIIGSGINGSAAAYYLAKSGVDVTVLEGASVIGGGGSSRNGGGVRQSGRDSRELPYVMWGIENLWPTLSEELDADTEYTQKGNLRLGKTQAHLDKLAQLAQSAGKVGLDVRMIDAMEAREINPYLSEEVAGASWCPTDGHANPLKTTLAFYRAARRLGARFYTNAIVERIEKVHGRARKVVLKNGMVFEADCIIVAAGYASRKIVNSVPGSTSMFCIALSAAGTFRFVMLPVTKPRKEPAVPSIGIKVTTSIKPTVQKIGATPMSPLRTGVIPGHES